MPFGNRLFGEDRRTVVAYPAQRLGAEAVDVTVISDVTQQGGSTVFFVVCVFIGDPRSTNRLASLVQEVRHHRIHPAKATVNVL